MKVKKTSETDADFSERIQKIVGQIGNAERFSKIVGISAAQIGLYMKGKADPARGRIMEMANAAGVRPEWLLTGEGPMRVGEAPPQPVLTAVTVPPLKKEILLEIIEALEMFLANNHLKMPPEKKAKFIVMAYELWQNEQDKKAAKSRIQQLFNLAA